MSGSTADCSNPAANVSLRVPLSLRFEKKVSSLLQTTWDAGSSGDLSTMLAQGGVSQGTRWAQSCLAQQASTRPPSWAF